MKPLHGDKLWDLLRKNDEIAFTQLYEQQWELLFQYAWRILRNREDAEAIVQHLFINLWNKRNVLPDVQSPKAYLSTAIRNSTLYFLQQRDHYAGLLQTVHERVGEEVNPPEMSRRENNAPLLNLTGQLPAQMQRVIVLHLFQDLSVREIADSTGTAEQTIRNQINDALKKLRKLSGTLFPLMGAPGMHATTRQLQELLKKYREQNCSVEDLQQLYIILDQLANSGASYPFTSAEEKALLKQEMWQDIATEKLAGNEIRIVPIRQRQWLEWVAIAVLIILAIGVLYIKVKADNSR